MQDAISTLNCGISFHNVALTVDTLYRAAGFEKSEKLLGYGYIIPPLVTESDSRYSVYSMGPGMWCNG